MLRDGTLLKVSPEIIQAIKNALDRRYQVQEPVRRTRRMESFADDGGLALGVIAQRPSGGYGPATWQPIELNADGSWTATGDPVAVIIPRF